MDDFAVDDGESAVELLVCAFPPVVTPQVVSRVAADGLFEQLEETACDGMLLQFAGRLNVTM